jgi:hypothetical protein
MTQNSQSIDEDILWTSDSWNNGNERTLTGHEEKDPDDSKLMLSAGDGRKLFIDGKGTAFLSGARSRMYFAVNNYNVMMQFTYTHNKTLDNISLRMRSLRNGDFGGYGFVISRDEIEAKYETTFGDQIINLGTKKLQKKIPDDSPVTVKWCIRDEGEKIQVKGWIQYEENGEFEEVFDESSDEYMDVARDKDRFLNSSTAWIRVNRKLGIAQDVPIKNVSIKEID